MLQNWNPIPIKQQFPFSLPPAPSNDHSTFFLYEFDYVGYLM